MAHHLAGNANERISALQRALQHEPASGLAACELADQYSLQGELDEARQRLLDAAAHAPHDGRVQRELARVLLELGDEDEARERLTRALRATPGDDAVIELLKNWAARFSDPEWALELTSELRPDAAVQFAQQLADRDSDAVDLRIKLADLHERSGQTDCALEVISATIKEHPTNPQLHDHLAQLLARSGRFDQALAACRPQIFGQSQPALLRFREADIRGHLGWRDQAVAEMTRLVRQEPDLVEAWRRLAEWTSEQPEEAIYLRAAEAWTRLSPDESVGWNHLGYASEVRQDYDGARASYVRAMQLAAGNVFAGLSLFNLLLVHAHPAEAEEVLEEFSPYLRYVDIVACQTRLAVARRDGRSARTQLGELCRLHTADGHLLSEVANAFLAVDWRQDMFDVVEDQVARQRATPTAGQLLIYILLNEGRWRECRKTLKQWTHCAEIWPAAARVYVERCRVQGNKIQLRRLLSAARDRLRGDVSCWAEIGAAYSDWGSHRAVVAWLGDWESRQDVQSAMLFPLSVALTCLGRDREAARVSLAALNLPPDEFSVFHSVKAAFEAAISGNVKLSLELMNRVDLGYLGSTPLYGDIAKLTLVLLDASQEAAQGSGKAALRDLRELTRQRPAILVVRLLQRYYFRAACRLAKMSNRPFRRAWYGLRVWLTKPRIRTF